VCGTVHIINQLAPSSQAEAKAVDKAACQNPPSLQRMSSGAQACRLRGFVQQTGR
jgi:hypothetical protein